MDTQKNMLRQALRSMLGIPEIHTPPKKELRGTVTGDGFIVEKWIYESEPGSWVTALLYLPAHAEGKHPVLLVTNGHGESKSTLAHMYAGPLYASLGIASLFIDTIGEEERHVEGQQGTRAHDRREADHCAAHAGRLMMGKMLLDYIRGFDFLTADPRLDANKMGVAGASLGCAAAQWLTALMPSIKVSLLSAFGLMEYNEIGKLCTSVPFKKLRDICTWKQFLSLFVPHSACLFINGMEDDVMDPTLSGHFLESLRDGESVLRQICREEEISASFQFLEVPGGGHRSYHLSKDAVLWLHHHLGTPLTDRNRILAMEQIRFGDWCDTYGFAFSEADELYWPERHYTGALFADPGVAPLLPEQLRCLQKDEIGSPLFTLEGWLDLL